MTRCADDGARRHVGTRRLTARRPSEQPLPSPDISAFSFAVKEERHRLGQCAGMSPEGDSVSGMRTPGSVKHVFKLRVTWVRPSMILPLLAFVLCGCSGSSSEASRRETSREASAPRFRFVRRRAGYARRSASARSSSGTSRLLVLGAAWAEAIELSRERVSRGQRSGTPLRMQRAREAR